jgi:tRNA 2-thiouridine synthesizing protein A
MLDSEEPNLKPVLVKQVLDLRQTKCPLNFVKTKLALEKLSLGDCLEIWIIAEAESAINIPQSIAKEGHQIIDKINEDDKQRLVIQRCK